MQLDAEMIVIGAGVAGLAAARELAESGKSVLVVEARDRVGGRIMTEHVGHESLELGAEFIHGKPPELWELVDEAKLETYELDGEELCLNGDLNEGAKLKRAKLDECGDAQHNAFQYLEALKDWDRDDCTFAAYLDLARVPAAVRPRLIGYVEGFNAADHHVIGVASLSKQQSAEDAIEGDRLFRIRGGYDQLPQFLARRVEEAGASIELNTQVTAVHWSQGQVEVQCQSCAQPRSLRALKAVITLPLGVLQAGSVPFYPPPQKVFDAAKQMRMGNVWRQVLLFEHPFWSEALTGSSDNVKDKLKALGFLFAFPEVPSVWWTQYPEPSSSITAWTGGPRSDTLASQTAEQQTTAALLALSRIFNVPEHNLKRILRASRSHNWEHDEWTKGAYTYVASNGVHASERMSDPVENTLYFAGEHTDMSGHWGTVHGALRSGMRAATQILAAP